LTQKTKHPDRTHTAEECAEELDLSLELIRDYMQRGCPHDKAGRRGHPNRLSPAEVTAWMKENHLTGKPGRPSEGDSPDLERANLRKANALAAKYEIQVKRELGQLAPVEEFRQWIGERITTAKNKFIGLGAAVAPLLEGRDAAERQTIIDARVFEILDELAAP
jgi:hypothetical protein